MLSILGGIMVKAAFGDSGCENQALLAGCYRSPPTYGSTHLPGGCGGQGPCVMGARGCSGLDRAGGLAPVGAIAAAMGPCAAGKRRLPAITALRARAAKPRGSALTARSQ